MTSCVIYVMPEDASSLLFLDANFTNAQTLALELKLPLAVVYCFEKATEKQWAEYLTDFENLQEVEVKLIKYGIPLMLLIGPKKDRLVAAIYHLKPKKVFYGQTSKLVRLNMPKKHPIAWPGPVQTINSLKEVARSYIIEDKNAC